MRRKGREREKRKRKGRITKVGSKKGEEMKE
jgi:hypothetical protein